MNDERRAGAGIPGWPVLLLVLLVGGAIRVAVWAHMPPSPVLVSDEGDYVGAGLTLAEHGQQDTFWPPVTGWLVCGMRLATGSSSLTVIRSLWVLLDIGNMVLLALLMARLARGVPNLGGTRAPVALLVVALYAVYAPAIAFAAIATSEVPAMFLLLGALLLVAEPHDLAPARAALAGVLVGLAVLTRSNLLPLVVALPAVVVLRQSRRIARGRSLSAALALALAAISVTGAYVVRNRLATNSWVISENALWNLYLGNNQAGTADLNIFHPGPTFEQAEVRRQMKAGTPTQELTLEGLRRDAVETNSRKPFLFVQRSLGRFVRVFAPKTNALGLFDRQMSLFSPWKLSALVASNLVYAFMLFAGIPGLLCLKRFNADAHGLAFAVIAGCVLLATLSLSGPRYSFPFDPLLMLGAFVLLADPAGNLAFLRANWWRCAGAVAFTILMVWAWAAAAIWGLSAEIVGYW